MFAHYQTVLRMWILLSILVACAALLYLSTLYEFVKYRLIPDKVKIWWLRSYKDYPRLRHTHNPVSQVFLDVLFRFDNRVHSATHASSNKSRIFICRALLCSTQDDDSDQGCVIFPSEHKLGWDSNLSEDEGGPKRQCSKYLYSGSDDVCAVHDVTHLVQAMWDVSGEGGELLLDQSSFASVLGGSKDCMVMIEYGGHANLGRGIRAQKFCAVYSFISDEGTCPQPFPPQHPRIQTLKGMDVRQVLYATMDGQDITKEIKSLAGPLSNFNMDGVPLDYCKLWFALWQMLGVKHIGDIIIEDTHLNVTRW
jgi:hypothetical protein